MIDIKTKNGRLDPDKLAQRVFARFDPLAAGISVGIVWGAFLGVATVACVVRGNPEVGAVMGLLSHYLPGYSVSWAGTVVGFIDAGVAGFGFGLAAALLNNLCLQICRVVIRTSAELKGMPQWP